MDVLLNWKTAFQVGQRLIERFTEDTARFKDALDIIKIICKDFLDYSIQEINWPSKDKSSGCVCP